MKLGSLFDGAGTCPFSAIYNGITPVWASEIEPFPVEVTAKRFPHMKQLGNITNIRGDNIEPVDVITFGSPCQDLSVAGKRAGLEGERSGLFMEAVRIIKEMRGETNGQYPQIAMWENVPGAFSSNKGEDFRVVLEELCKVKDSGATIPRPPKRGGATKWTDAGLILGDGYSLAWRVLDAQFWGIPQRRKRIFLIADFGGQRAGEILFERESLSRDFAESRKSWQGITSTAERSSNTSSRTVAFSFDSLASNSMKSSNPYSGCREVTVSKCLDTTSPCPSKNQGGIAVLQPICCYDIGDRRNIPKGEVDISPTLIAKMGTGGNNVPIIIQPQDTLLFENHSQDSRYTGPLEICPTVSATYGMGGNNTPFVLQPQKPLVMATAQANAEIGVDVSPTITAAAGMSGNNQPIIFLPTAFNMLQDTVYEVNKTPCLSTGNPKTGQANIAVYALDRASFNQGINAQFDIGIDSTGIAQTLVAKGPGAVATCHVEEKPPKEIRRITPTECSRLQGMPDWWCIDITHSDSAEYKMWGNGMALPCVLYCMEGIAKVLTSRWLDDLLEVTG